MLREVRAFAKSCRLVKGLKYFGALDLEYLPPYQHEEWMKYTNYGVHTYKMNPWDIYSTKLHLFPFVFTDSR